MATSVYADQSDTLISIRPEVATAGSSNHLRQHTTHEEDLEDVGRNGFSLHRRSYAKTYSNA